MGAILTGIMQTREQDHRDVLVIAEGCSAAGALPAEAYSNGNAEDHFCDTTRGDNER